VFARSQPALRKSITFDNNTAFAQHAMLRTMRAMTTWFCDAHASWQRAGSKTLTADCDADCPVRADIDKVSDEEIQDIVATGNLTPRKYLGLKTPFSGNPPRAWQRRSSPVCIALLHFAPD
jgi:transposase, IS30 family